MRLHRLEGVEDDGSPLSFTGMGWASKTAIEQDWGMRWLLRLVQRFTGPREIPPLHTPEELECFKADAIENHAKHY